MKKLPVGIQSFRIVIEEDCAYADKTKDIYSLIQQGRYYFLSRPRRFGKSLLVDTMHELFSGNRELFKGLWIAGPESDYAFKPHPVVRLDMTQFGSSSASDVKSGLMALIRENAESEQMELKGSNPAESLAWLIRSLAAKHG